jgi:NADH-quinone oxidoreductase subunit M
MTGFLSIIILTPLAGALAIGLWGRLGPRGIKYLALAAAIIPMALAVYLFTQFDRAAAGSMQFVEKLAWIPPIDAYYHLGVDGLSLPLVLLTALLGVIAVLISWRQELRVRKYFIWLLLLEASILGVFCSLDLLLFFVFWEIEVIPMYFLISIWGSGRKEYSAIKYVLYTLAGSALMLTGIVGVYFATGSLDITELSASGRLLTQSVLPAAPLFFLLITGFCVKLPVFPFHTWLPDAHTDAPTAASVMLAGSLIKMGGYGIIRLGVGLFPALAQQYAPLFLTLAVIGIVYGGAITLRQTDIKRLIAYSSVSHMGFVLLGIFALSQVSLTGAALQMVSHGLITGLLFAVAGMLMHNAHERDIRKLGGLAVRMPRIAVLFIIAGLGALGLPSTSGFVAEFSIFLGAFSSAAVAGIKVYVIIGLLGLLLGAGYILWLIQRVFFGPPLEAFSGVKDADRLELFYGVVMIALIFMIGLYPNILTDIFDGGVAPILRLIGA